MKKDNYSRGSRHYSGCGKGCNDPHTSRKAHDARHMGDRYTKDHGREYRHDEQGPNASGQSHSGYHGYAEYNAYEERKYDSYAQGSLFSGPFYRARGGKIMGVCLGLSRRFDISPFFVRAAFIFLAISSGFMPAILLYIILGVLMKPEPVISPHSYDERDFYSSYVSSRKQAASRLKNKFDRVEKRIRDMENVVTSKEYDWERRFSQKN